MISLNLLHWWRGMWLLSIITVGVNSVCAAFRVSSLISQWLIVTSLQRSQIVTTAWVWDISVCWYVHLSFTCHSLTIHRCLSTVTNHSQLSWLRSDFFIKMVQAHLLRTLCVLQHESWAIRWLPLWGHLIQSGPHWRQLLVETLSQRLTSVCWWMQFSSSQRW